MLALSPRCCRTGAELYEPRPSGSGAGASAPSQSRLVASMEKGALIGTLQVALVAVAGGIVFFWLLFALLGPRQHDGQNTIVVLRYGSVLQVLALIAALAPPNLMACIVWMGSWRSESELLMFGVSILGASAIAGLLLIEVVRAQIVLTEDGITRFSPWTGQATLRWADVESVRYSAVNRWFVVRATNATIRVSRHLVGVREFAETVKRKVAAERLSSAMAALDAT